MIGRLLLDLLSVAKHPGRWPALEISAVVYRAGTKRNGLASLGVPSNQPVSLELPGRARDENLEHAYGRDREEHAGQAK